MARKESNTYRPRLDALTLDEKLKMVRLRDEYSLTFDQLSERFNCSVPVASKGYKEGKLWQKNTATITTPEIKPKRTQDHVIR